MDVNIGRMFANRAFLSPDLDACAGEGYAYNYQEMDQRLNQFAAHLKASGIQTGDRIAILVKNNEQVLTALFGAAKIGVISVVLNHRLTAPELSYILTDSHTRLLVHGFEFDEIAQALTGETPVELFLRVGGDADEFENALAAQSADAPEIQGGGEDPAVLMYTSGTTGNPKGAILTHNNCFWAAIGLIHTLDWSYKDRYLSVAPLFHIGGLAPIFANIHIGASMVFMPDFDPTKIWQMVEDYRINVAMTVPVMLQYMNMFLDKEKTDISSLKFFICGGAPVPKMLIDLYDGHGIEVNQVYGATEYAGAITFWLHDMGMDMAHSMGKPVFHGSIKVINPTTGEELPAGETGELCLMGPQVFKGYWENPAATEEVLVDNYYRSGDLGKVDHRGFVFVLDRLKDMIISGGENIYPAEIEAVLLSHPAIVEAAVVGKADEQWGEIPAAYLVKAQDAQVTEDEITALCREKLAGFKRVKEIHFIDQVPKNTLGKVLKRSLREMK